MKDINSIKLTSHSNRIYAECELIGSVHFSESTFIDEERRDGESWLGMRDRTAGDRRELESKATQYASMFAAAPELLEACLRIQAQLSQAGVASVAGSLNPAEDAASQIDAAIKKALGQ